MTQLIEKQTLSGELADSRTLAGSYVAAVRRDLDIVPRLKALVAENRLAWFAGAAIAGWILSQLLPGKREFVAAAGVSAVRREKQNPTAKAGQAAVLLTAFKFALDLARPAMVAWLKEKVLGAGKTPPS